MLQILLWFCGETEAVLYAFFLTDSYMELKDCKCNTISDAVWQKYFITQSFYSIEDFLHSVKMTSTADSYNF